MSLSELLRRVVAILDEERVPYMLTGSLASAYYATPRATRDIDIVLDTDRGGLDRLVGRLQGVGLYVDRGAAQEALSTRSQFNAIAPLGDPELQRRDVLELLERAGKRIDRDYVDRWVRELGLEDEWSALRRRAEPAPEDDTDVA